jgi:Na+/melibiose symporter-like transporter
MSDIRDVYLVNNDNVDLHTHELELILTLTVIFWITDLSKNFDSFECIGWFVMIIIIFLICNMILTIKEHITRREGMDHDTISSSDVELGDKFENSIISGVIILFLFCLGGAFYIWYTKKILDWSFITRERRGSRIPRPSGWG